MNDTTAPKHLLGAAPAADVRRFSIPPLTSDELAACESVASRYRIAGRFRRVYQIHVRKAGGTSLNHSFYALCGDDPVDTYQSLLKSPKRVLIRNSYIFVAGNEHAINEGHYYYASSHIPLYRLTLPEQTCTVATFRDPLERLLSHYRMLLEFQQTSVFPSYIAGELTWLGSSLREFVTAMPKEHLLNQLHMFSAGFDAEEALDNVRRLTHYFWLDALPYGLARLAEKLQLPLAPFHVRRSTIPFDVTTRDRAYLRELLEPEFSFVEKLRRSP